MSEYTPDNWVILKIQYEGETLYKVLAGWSGGYLDSDYWRMNSGITRVVEQDDYWEFYGNSGSCYNCYKGQYRLRMNNAGIYEQLKNTSVATVEMMPEDTNWMEIEWADDTTN